MADVRELLGRLNPTNIKFDIGSGALSAVGSMNTRTSRTPLALSVVATTVRPDRSRFKVVLKLVCRNAKCSNLPGEVSR